MSTFSYLFPCLIGDLDAHLPYGANGALLSEVVEGLTRLAASMRDLTADPVDGIPSGMTYLAQFVAHDLAHDVTPRSSRRVDATLVENARTPALDLDSLYGSGPVDRPAMYHQRGQPGSPRGIKLLFGDGNNPFSDLPRNKQGYALIGDPRNDENLLVAQITVIMTRFHNALVDRAWKPGADPAIVFQDVRKTATHHYQWMIWHDLLPRLVPTKVLSDVETNGPQYFGAAQIPVEFSVAAFRFGHSMVRSTYSVNDRHPAAPAADLFRFTSSGATDLLNVVPAEWIPDLRRFFWSGAVPTHANVARPLHAGIASALHEVPEFGGHGGALSVPEATLMRGYAYGLPSGESIAYLLGETPLDPKHIQDGFGSAGSKGEYPAILIGRTPLWYYVLRECEKHNGGLGPVGSRIVAETVFGLLQSDASSYWHQPGWQPSLGATAGQFDMLDLLRVANIPGFVQH